MTDFQGSILEIFIYLLGWGKVIWTFLNSPPRDYQVQARLELLPEFSLPPPNTVIKVFLVIFFFFHNLTQPTLGRTKYVLVRRTV